MLFSRTQLRVEHVPLGSDVCENGRVAVVPLVGERHARFPGTGVVQRTDIHVNGHQVCPARVHAAQPPGFEKTQVQLPQGGVTALLGHLVEALAENGFGREPPKSKGMGEKTDFPVEVHVVDVRAGVAKHPDLGYEDVTVTDRTGSFRRKVFGACRLGQAPDQKTAEMISAGADQFVLALP